MKMPENLTIWIDNKLTARGKHYTDPVEYDKDLTLAMKVGDEVGAHTGKTRHRTTYYKVVSVYANSVTLKRNDAIQAEKHQDTRTEGDINSTDPEAATVLDEQSSYPRAENTVAKVSHSNGMVTA